MSHTTGYTFGNTELATGDKLNLLVNSATHNSNWLTSLASASGKINPQTMWNLRTIATNASITDVSTGTIFKVWASTVCSIATFVNARIGQQFTLIAGQASFPAILDGGAFLLSATWQPATAGDNITLVWDGTSFIEIARVSV